MSAQPQPGAFREQDGQALQVDHPGHEPHIEWRWDERIGTSEWTVRAAYRDGDVLDWPGAAYARYHEPTGTIIVAEWGFLQTVIRVDEAELDATQAALARSEVGDDA
ncbi:hypothetical protein SAMN05216388_1017135 [Halorientalis persicus]|uniref:RelE toxin-related domain-containing protein n=1 Tax=Halorientalis persicus TaxID=1367881 RepID=A0A1H8S3D6_9EURY|nr:hypothetical protein [Halorientalis persicus]SEO73165.1 hypothetical protein SAMN05216388_1017135 [Halorientalis persicus]